MEVKDRFSNNSAEQKNGNTGYETPSRSLQWGRQIDSPTRSFAPGASSFERSSQDTRAASMQKLYGNRQQEEAQSEYLDARSLMANLAQAPARVEPQPKQNQKSARDILYGGTDRAAYTGNQSEDYNSTFLYTPTNKISFTPTSQYYEQVQSGTTYVPPKYNTQQASRHTFEDLAPSGKTMQHYNERERDNMEKFFEQKISNNELFNAQEPEVNTKEKKTTRSFSKTKGMIALYAAVVIVLAILIVTTGTLISRANKAAAAMESNIEQLHSDINEKIGTLSDLSTESVILERAKELGMVKAGKGTSIKQLQLAAAPVYTAGTNWFDRFCDWFSWAS